MSFVDKYTISYEKHKRDHNDKKMNLYQTLMVEENASIYQIKEMSDKLTIVFNRIPKDQLTKEHQEIIATIKEADLTLSDPNKRAEYDAKLHTPKYTGRLSVKNATSAYNNIGNTSSPTSRTLSQSKGIILQ